MPLHYRRDLTSSKQIMFPFCLYLHLCRNIIWENILTDMDKLFLKSSERTKGVLCNLNLIQMNFSWWYEKWLVICPSGIRFQILICYHLKIAELLQLGEWSLIPPWASFKSGYLHWEVNCQLQLNVGKQLWYKSFISTNHPAFIAHSYFDLITRLINRERVRKTKMPLSLSSAQIYLLSP